MTTRSKGYEGITKFKNCNNTVGVLQFCSIFQQGRRRKH